MFDARILRPPILPLTAYALKIRGDGMAPRYLKGELVYAVPERQRRPSLYAVVGLHVADEPNRLTVRRVAEYLASGLLLATGKDHAAKRDPLFVSYDNLLSFHPLSWPETINRSELRHVEMDDSAFVYTRSKTKRARFQITLRSSRARGFSARITESNRIDGQCCTRIWSAPHKRTAQRPGDRADPSEAASSTRSVKLASRKRDAPI